MPRASAFYLLLFALGLFSVAEAGVRTVPVYETLRDPAADPQDHDFQSTAVAIDGDSIIVLTQSDTQRSALLYRRDSAGHWAFNRYLQQQPVPAGNVGYEVAMKNNIAVIKLGQVATIWEKVSGNWVQGVTVNEWRHPGRYVISVNRVMAGADGCEADAIIYQKSTIDGRWGVTGRIEPQAGVCANLPRDVELNYDNALVRSENVVRGYRRNGSAVSWPATFSQNLGSQAVYAGPPAMQKSTFVMPGSAYYRQFTGGWSYAGMLTPLDYLGGSGEASRALFRDNVLLMTEGALGYRSTDKIYAYLQNTAGGFDHVAVLDVPGTPLAYDVSGNTVVAATADYFGIGAIVVVNLPTPLRAPRTVSNNFESRDVSGFTQTSLSQFALANDDGRNWVYRQYGNARGYALWSDSYWPHSQSISARIVRGGASGASSWVGLAARYSGADNTYLAYVDGNNVARIVARQNAMETTLAETQLTGFPVGQDLRFSVRGDRLVFQAGSAATLTATDSRFPVGRVGLVTEGQADYDDVVISPTAGFDLLSRNYLDVAYGRPFTEAGGTWPLRNEGEPLRQTGISEQALAIGGTRTADQVVEARMRVDQFGSTSPVSWAGVVARYVDARTFYYLSVRSSHQLQIRKIVGGATTVLAAKPFTPVAGQYHRYKLLVVGSELRAYVDGVLIASATDSEIGSGQYGVGTYRAAASWSSIRVVDP
jgi:hypothetical protein